MQEKEDILSKELKTTKRKRTRISTGYFELLADESLQAFANQLTYVANNPNKYSIFELSKDKTAEFIPFVILRLQEDIDAQDKDANIKVKMKVFSGNDLSGLDELINEGIKPNSSVQLLGEIRYVHITLGLCIVLIWAEAEAGVRQRMEGVYAIRALCKNLR